MENKSRNSQAESIIKHRVLLSMGAGLIPIPVFDLVAITTIQLDMIRDLSRLYQLDFAESNGRNFVTALTGSLVARIGASMIKMIPGVGSILGGVSMSIMSGASTYAIGMLTMESFEQGKSIRDMNADDLADTYNRLFEEGKAVVKDWKEQEDQNQAKGQQQAEAQEQPSSFDAVTAKLKNIHELKESGVITEEEYLKIKQKLLEGLV